MRQESKVITECRASENLGMSTSAVAQDRALGDFEDGARDFAILTRLLRKRDDEVASLCRENGLLEDELAAARQELDRRGGLDAELQRKRAEIAKLEKVVATLQTNSRKWEALARQVSGEASAQFAAVESLKETLGKVELEKTKISRLLQSVFSQVSIETRPRDFRPVPRSCPALRTASLALLDELASAEQRLHSLEAEIADISDFPGERIDKLHAEFTALMALSAAKTQELGQLAVAVENEHKVRRSQITVPTPWNSSLK